MEFQNRLPTSHVSWTIAPNVLTWFLKRAPDNFVKTLRSILFKNDSPRAAYDSCVYFICLYWQCIFASIVNFRNIYHPLEKWFASQQPPSLLRLHLPCHLFVSWHHLLCLKSGPFAHGMILTSCTVKNWSKMPTVFHNH